MQQYFPDSMGPMNAFASGQAFGQQLRDNRYRKQVANAFATGDLQGAQQLAASEGRIEDMQAIQQQIAQMDESQRAQVQDRLQRTAQFALGLKNMPPAQRAQMAQQYAPQLGLDPQMVAGLDLSDPAIDAFVTSQVPIMEALGQQNKERQLDQTDYTNQTGRMNANTNRMNADTARMKAENPPAGGEIRLPDGTVVRTGGNVKESQMRPTIMGGGLADAAGTLSAIFDGETNPLNSTRNIAAAGVSAVPGGDAIGRMIGGDEFQEIDQPRKMAEAALLPILSGAAVTPTEGVRFQAAFVPQVGDTPRTANIKARALEGLSARVAQLQAQGVPLTPEQYRQILAQGEAEMVQQLGQQTQPDASDLGEGWKMD